MSRLTFVAFLLTAAVVALAVMAAVDAARFDVTDLADHAPRRTALMRQRAAEAAREGRAYRIDQRWVPYERISPTLRRAVLIAEDDAFYQHGGLDWNELQASARRNLEEHRIVRGGSTITQQLAKNLFLGAQRTPTRKIEELFLALRMERALSKRRIFELYLNLIEWGDGVFGAEAAAHRLFGVSASQLDVRQSVRLAAIIINPRRYSALTPSRRIERRVRMIASRMRRRGYLDAAGYAAVLGLPTPAPPESTRVETAAVDSTTTPSALEPAPSTSDTTAPPADTGAIRPH